jgi:hypothetical protein
MLIAVFTLLCIMYNNPCRSSSNLAYDRIQAYLLAFCALLLFAAVISFDYYFANRTVPDSINHTDCTVTLLMFRFRSDPFLVVRLLAIVPWFTALCTAAASVVLYQLMKPVTQTDTEEA